MIPRVNSILLKPNIFVGSPHRPRFSSSNKGMDNQPQTPSKGDVMSKSFGEGYATRSDEEGFGGIYSENQKLDKDRKEINENSPEFDKYQGSVVKEKEKGRNLSKDSACS